MDALNYQPLAGRPMRIMWSHRDPAGRRSGVGNVFIKNLDKDIDHKALHDTFSAFGDILSAKVAVDAAGQSKGYGFVHFEKAEAAEAAIEKVNGMLLEGRKVFVGHFVKRDSRPDGGEAKFTNVFLKNLPEGTDEEALLKMCSAFGKVTSHVLTTDDDGKPKGFGFVNFEDADAAAACVAALNGKPAEGPGAEDKLPMFAGRAQKKAEREAELATAAASIATSENEAPRAVCWGRRRQPAAEVLRRATRQQRSCGCAASRHWHAGSPGEAARRRREGSQRERRGQRPSRSG